MKKLVTLASVCAFCLVLAVSAQETQTQTLYGQITSGIGEDSKSLTMKTLDDKTQTMTLTNIKVKNSKGQACKLSDLEKGYRIECVCTKTDTANTYNCSEIRQGRIAKGEITNINEANSTIKMTENDKEITMILRPITRFRNNGEVAKLSDLKKGQQCECECVLSTENTYNCYEVRWK